MGWLPLPGTAQQTAKVPVDNSAIDAPLLYQLLLGELNYREGDPGAGFSFILDAARRSNDPELYKRAATMAVQARSGEAALQAASAWKQAYPQSREANQYVLQLLIGLNRLGEVLPVLKHELALTPAAELPETISGLPRYFARLNDKRPALNLLEQALHGYLKQANTGVPAWTTLGRMHMGLGDSAGALECVKRAIALDTHAIAPMMLALSLIAAKEPQAEALVKQHLSQHNAPELRLAYTRLLLETQRYSEAEDQAKRLTQDQPELATPWLIQGVLALENKRNEAAELAFKRFLSVAENKPQSPEHNRELAQAYLALAQIAEQRQDLDTAQNWLDKVNAPEEQVRYQTRRAAILAQQGKFDEALTLVRELPDNTPEAARNKLSAEASLLRDTKRYAEAFDLLQSWTTLNPGDADLLYDQAMVADKLKRFEDMEGLLRQIILNKPDFQHAYNALGYALADRNERLDEARSLIEKALSLAPNDPFISDSLGWVLFRQGKKAQAEKVLQAAYKTKPDVEIAAHLGEVLWSLGKREAALKVWREGLRTNPKNEVLTETLKRLRVTP